MKILKGLLAVIVAIIIGAGAAVGLNGCDGGIAGGGGGTSSKTVITVAPGGKLIINNIGGDGVVKHDESINNYAPPEE